MLRTWIVVEEEQDSIDEIYKVLLESSLNSIQNGYLSPAVGILKEIINGYPETALPYLYLANLYSIKDEKWKALNKFNQVWELRNNLPSLIHLIPYQAVFLLLTFEPLPKDHLKMWFCRALDFYDLYDYEHRLIINLAKQILDE
jgi:hypothetical protein